ncbi:histone deacetylation protein Rxt3-domain-containing protein [Gamsiella multidivaricata]|uniref:histone deacetylation protein Rxt3-domain-containing protein n=1 Tax=Gamsiella multidivaricata TaxID=101098 RepID=UPI002220E9C3|nr:histone deacetylation protein Rxt3-domain-containing protein [Gamsiella multidivaricata]KAI7824630.1 histone deacetylation protein Rxt3-domain-containing protein [Gamsiella multidivaricata]
MDTKKRPNEDSLKPGPESSSLAGLAEGLVSMDTGKTGHAISTLMDVDAANRESSSALTTPAPNATAVSSDALQPSNEANKRIKLTIDADKSGAEYSPSLDVADPSEESKGLAEWVEKMDDDDNKEKNDVESAAEPVLPSTKAVSAAVSQDGEMSKSEANADAATTLPNPSTTPSHNLVHALVTAEAAPSASELTGSILAVASLSEPLVTTLETLETGIQTVDSKAVSQPTEAATIPADNSPLSLISTSVTKDSEALTAINDKTGTQEQTQDVNEESITQSTKEDAIPNAPNGADPSEKESNQSSSENRQHSQAERPQSPTAGRTPPEHTLPPLSSLSTTPALSDPLQNTRPSRSTMSVSALLLNNDDDSEQEQERERRMSRNIFDQFEIPHPDSSSITSISTIQKVPQSSTPSIPPPQRHSPALSSPSATQAQLATSGQAAPPSISPRPTGAAGNALRSRDQVDSQPMNQNQAGFNRAVTENNQSSGRRQDPTRATPSKDYPADEVMESGGIGLFGSQRHRLASPVGVRPLQEPINGLGGAGPVNGKLPGLVSVTSIASTHIHDPHGHPGSSYRGESSHGLMAGRSSPYSAGQHATASHPPTVNGHLHYPSTGHTGHHSGIAPAAPIASMTSASTSALAQHPRLIVKNDPSLTKSDRPEFFLGYYRYEPSLLLPDMQGKENSLLEVRIASSYLTYDNIKVKRREIWGTDIYTDDSDVVAMLIHGGLFIPPISAQSTEEDSIRPTGQQHNFAPDPIKHICPGFDLAVTLRILPKLVKYQGSIRNRIKSRTWSTGHDGVSFKIESIRKMCPGEALNRGRSQSKQRMKEYNQERLRVLANIHDETTESLQNEKAMRTATFEFTHQGDPCIHRSWSWTGTMGFRANGQVGG